MKIIIFIFSICFFYQTFSYQELIDDKIGDKKVKIIKVIIDSEDKIITSISEKGESLEELTNKVNGTSSVNGAYFCPEDYKVCNGINFTDRARVFSGTLYSKWKNDFGSSGMFGFDKDNNPLLILKNDGYTPGINKKINTQKIEEISYGIANYPVLIINGTNVINESLDILDKKMKTLGTKSFICSLEDNKTIFMGSVENILVEDMSEYLINNFNCFNAINLDSGGSLGMIFNNEVIKKPGRKIMDAFVVIKIKKEDEIDKKYGKVLKKFYTKMDLIYKNNPENIDKVILNLEKVKSKIDKEKSVYKIYTKVIDYSKNLKEKGK